MRKTFSKLYLGKAASQRGCWGFMLFHTIKNTWVGCMQLESEFMPYYGLAISFTGTALSAHKLSHNVLVEWVAQLGELPTGKKELCLQVIREKNLAFGKTPFDSEENTQSFFRWTLKDNDMGNFVGALAYARSRKYTGESREY
eukprot:gb/GECG01003018.1/.p1 GENE.gb/GECG01003018.1/~~gb/GECG01003018.1/.p1  ORF type:complete len:143 (+),score=11.61 gb/GECG01003018.1/:1-429(+)